MLIQLFSQLYKQQLKLLIGGGFCFSLGNEIPDLLLRLFFDILPQVGLQLEQMVLLLLENIVSETASQVVDTLLGEVAFLPFGLDHQMDMRVMPGVVKGCVPL